MTIIFYLNAERSGYEPIKEKNDLAQSAIDNAFKNAQIESSNRNLYKKKSIIVTAGKRTDKLGVLSKIDGQTCYYYTDLERTLIDIVVKPIYANGVEAVLRAFKKARSIVDLEKLKKYLEILDYVYPYEECLGYYLDKAGYKNSQSVIFKQDFNYDFYLAHNINETAYNEK